MLEKCPGCGFHLGKQHLGSLHLHFPLHLLRWLSDFCQVCLSVVLHLLIFVSQGEPTWSWSFSSFSSLSAACCSLFLDHSKKSSYCILVFCLYVCVCTMCAWYPQSPEESNRSLETGNTNLCELSCRCQELTLKSLQEQGGDLNYWTTSTARIFRPSKSI